MSILNILMKKEIFCCKPCAVARGVKLIREGRDEKGQCAFCGRRRYGAWYSL